MAKGITEAVLDEIKSRVDLADLVSSYGIEVRTAGSSKKACCPFHREKTPSFNINESRGFYHCFGCGESGDAIKFVEKMEGLSFVDAVKKLAAQTGVKIEEAEDPEAGRRARLYALLAELAQFYRRCLATAKEGELAREYLKKRDLGPEIQEAYLVGYAPKGAAVMLKWAEKYGYSERELDAAGVVKAADRPGGLGYHRFGGRLMFAIRDRQGRVVGFSGRQLVPSKNSGKYVNSPETVVFKKSNVLYGFDKASAAITRAPNREAIVCEGQIDCIRLQACGFPNSVAGQGTAFTEEHARMLAKSADQVALVYDDDTAGHKAAVKTARLCLAAGLPARIVSLPDGDDPDSYLRTHSADDFRKLLDGAEGIIAFQVRTGRAAESRPDSVDAVNRITNEILRTVAQCSGAVLKATMLAEAARLLKLPETALAEELGRMKPAAPAAAPQTPEMDGPSGDTGVEDSAEKAFDAATYDGEDAAETLPPTGREFAFCEFLLANEYAAEAKELDKVVGEYLPEEVFSHDFTRRFVATWREEIAGGEDLIAPWGDSLAPRERRWFDSVLAGQGKSLECALTPMEILREFVRSLWADRLGRIRGELPASGGPESDMERLKLTMDLKRIGAVKWRDVAGIVRAWKGGGTAAGT